MTDPIKTLIITDPLTDETPQEEIESITHWLGWNYIPIEATHSYTPIVLEDTKPELVVVDYGAISVSGGWDTARSNISYICQWAKDHPGKLVLIWTYFTAQVYLSELQGEFQSEGNILFWCSPSEMYPGVKEEEKYQEEISVKIRRWFNLPNTPIWSQAETDKLIPPPEFPEADNA